MMWCCCVILSLGCVGLRMNEAAARLGEEDEKDYSVQVALSLAGGAESGSAIDIALDGRRHLTRIHPTSAGRPVVLHHVPRGSVVTARVHASKDACAHWVGAGPQTCKVGDWELTFAIFDESDRSECAPGASYEAYLHFVGEGEPVTVEVNHAPAVVKTPQSNETLLYPGLHRGALVKVVSETGDTCTHHAGNEEVMCNLDNLWGLRIGSVAHYDEDERDEGVSDIDVREYTVELMTLGLLKNHSRVIEIELNGERIARKKAATKEEEEQPLVLNHVKTGSVLTAISHARGEACGFYVGSAAQTKTCAGWTLNYTSREETDDDFDVSVTVLRGSTEQIGNYSVEAPEIGGKPVLRLRNWPTFFPDVSGGWPKDGKIVPYVKDQPVENCVHVVGGAEISCEGGGWVFTISSRLNADRGAHYHRDWDYIEQWDAESVHESGYTFTVTATDTTKSKSMLECVALQPLDLHKLGSEEYTDIERKKPLFTAKELVKKQGKCTPNDLVDVKSASFTGEISGRRRLNGFVCTVYEKDKGKMCEANTNGMSRTLVQGCTLHIKIHHEMR